MVEWPHDQMFYRKKRKIMHKAEAEVSAELSKRRAVDDTTSALAFNEDGFIVGLAEVLPTNSLLPPPSMTPDVLALPPGHLPSSPLPLMDHANPLTPLRTNAQLTLKVEALPVPKALASQPHK